MGWVGGWVGGGGGWVGGGVGVGPMSHVEFERSHVSCDYLLIPCHH